MSSVLSLENIDNSIYFSDSLEKEYELKTNLLKRREIGQFFTPFKVAKLMSEWILNNPNQNLSILDPCSGFGVFERALVCKNCEKKLHFTLYEIDKDVIDKFKEKIPSTFINYDLYVEDFLNSSWNDKFDGIISNPPYYKHHFIKNKESVLNKICNQTGFNFSIQTNIYCWFLIKCMNQLKDNGRLAFIIPSEFLNSNYGEKVKQYLLNFDLNIHLLNIDFNNNVFDKAITTSIIVLAEKNNSKNENIKFYNIKRVEELENLELLLNNSFLKDYNIANLNPKIKWRNYFNPDFVIEGNNRKLISFSTMGRFSRGIATGANDYFTLAEEEVKSYKIPEECLIPCITKANYARDIVFTDDDYHKLLKGNKKVFLFDGEKSKQANCRNYIIKGELAEINQKYLTKNRNPWYSLEKRNPSQIWVSVFGRSGLKFIWNQTNCLNLTCFHAFYPNLIGNKFIDILFLYLNTDFAKKLFEQEKREYGNGLEKFEPNDINKSKILNFDLLSESDLNLLNKLQKELIISENKKRKIILEEANIIFKRVFE